MYLTIFILDRIERYTLDFIRFGGDLLSHALRRSTISASALNCRVRNGAGCFARAMATKPNKVQRYQTFLVQLSLFVMGLYSLLSVEP